MTPLRPAPIAWTARAPPMLPWAGAPHLPAGPAPLTARDQQDYLRAAACMRAHGVTIAPDHPAYSLLRLTPAQVAPILPYLLLVLMLIIRPKGLLGTRES